MTRGVTLRVSRARLAELRADPSVTNADIAAQLGVHRSTVSRVANLLGLPSQAGRKRVLDHDAVAEMWRAGLTSREIGAALGCPPAYVRALARRMDLPRRLVRRAVA